MIQALEVGCSERFVLMIPKMEGRVWKILRVRWSARLAWPLAPGSMRNSISKIMWREIEEDHVLTSGFNESYIHILPPPRPPHIHTTTTITTTTKSK